MIYLQCRSEFVEFLPLCSQTLEAHCSILSSYLLLFCPLWLSAALLTLALSWHSGEVSLFVLSSFLSVSPLWWSHMPRFIFITLLSLVLFHRIFHFLFAFPYKERELFSGVCGQDQDIFFICKATGNTEGKTDWDRDKWVFWNRGRYTKSWWNRGEEM